MVYVRDRQGHRYDPVDLGFKGEDTGRRHLAQTLAPAESFEQTFGFVVPAAADEPTVWVTQDTSWLSRLLPFLERTPLHSKVVVPLPPQK